MKIREIQNRITMEILSIIPIGIIARIIEAPIRFTMGMNHGMKPCIIPTRRGK